MSLVPVRLVWSSLSVVLWLSWSQLLLLSWSHVAVGARDSDAREGGSRGAERPEVGEDRGAVAVGGRGAVLSRSVVLWRCCVVAVAVQCGCGLLVGALARVAVLSSSRVRFAVSVLSQVRSTRRLQSRSQYGR
jgi:hypothetical protein